MEVEKEIVYYEVKAKAKGQVLIESDDYNKIRSKLVFLICEMNKVANIEGKGRDDLTIDILLKAEAVIRKVSVNCSKSIRNLAEGVKNSFLKFRKMLSIYGENIESVDPQLKNNSELVENLLNLEQCWEKGKEFLLNDKNFDRLMFFSQLIEILCEKYKDLSELIDSRDPSIFVSIPGLLILMCLEDDDHGICKEYNPNMFTDNKECSKIYSELKIDYDDLKSKLDKKYLNPDYRSQANSRIQSSRQMLNIISNNSKNSINNNELDINLNYSINSIKQEDIKVSHLDVKFDLFFLYNFLEQIILFEENFDKDYLEVVPGYKKFYDKPLVIKFMGKIKMLSMNLQREKPSEWNSFFDMAMSTIQASNFQKD